jgi:hypothetical protein
MMRHSQKQKYRGTETTLMSLPQKYGKTEDDGDDDGDKKPAARAVQVMVDSVHADKAEESEKPLDSSVSFASSSCVHLPFLCAVVPSAMVGSKLSTQLLRHCTFVRVGTSAATAAQSSPSLFTASVSFESSSGFHLRGGARAREALADACHVRCLAVL